MPDSQKLHIADNLSLPVQAITETFGILAVRGAGKSNTAAAMAEEMFKASLPFVVVDPVGCWYGLRSSKDGKGPGLPIPIFGGKRGDVPLERGGGQLVADLVVDQRLSCVLDLSTFDSERSKKQFLLEFAQRLYRRNENPLHLFLEEADDYIPQRPMGKDDNYLLRAWENIVRRGRSRGLGMTLITQRSASLNKNVLTQVQTLIAMRTTGPQDRKAIEEWVKYHDQQQEILESLSGLEDGEAWVWSPDFLRKTVRVKFRRRETFDSAATPKANSSVRTPATLADVDISALTQRMAATIQKAKAEDPVQLRRQIADLKRQLQARPTETKPVQVPVEVPVLKDAQLDKALALVQKMDDFSVKLAATLTDLTIAIKTATKPQRPISGPRAAPRSAPNAPLSVAPRHSAKTTTRVDSDSELTGPEHKILDALAWCESIGIMEPEQAAIAFLSGYTYGGGGFNNPRGALNTKGLIEYVQNRQMRLTDAGRALARQPERPLTVDEMHRMVMSVLPGPEKRVLKPLLESYPNPMSNEDLAKAANYEFGSGGFNNPRGRLRSLGLIEYRPGGFVAARSILFLE
jgi:uncharacterized protein